MKTVNLLPEWYLAEFRQRRRFKVHLLLMVTLAAAALGAAAVGRGHLAQLTAARDKLDRESRLVQDQTEQIAAARASLAQLETTELARRELGNTVPMSAVVQQILNEMTTGMSPSRLGLEVRNEAIRGTGFVGDAKNPPRYHEVAHLTVVGVAPSDGQIASLIEKISANPLFGDVSLNYTHREVLRDRVVRRFEIQMTLDLDRLGGAAAGALQQASAGGDHGP